MIHLQLHSEDDGDHHFYHRHFITGAYVVNGNNLFFTFRWPYVLKCCGTLSEQSLIHLLWKKTRSVAARSKLTKANTTFVVYLPAQILKAVGRKRF